MTMALPQNIGAPAGKGGSANPDAAAPKVTQDGDPPATHDAAKGGPLPPCDPPASRMPLIGTVAGNAQRKPFNVK